MVSDEVGRGLSRMGDRGRQAIFSMFGVAMDFEQSMANVRSTIVGLTDTGFAQLTQRAKDLGATTRFTASEVGQAMFFMGQAGLNTKEILAGVNDTLNLAAAGGLELGRASDIATDIMAEFGLEATDIGRITDVLVVGAQSATTNVRQLGAAMAKVGPIAKTIGISVEEATAFTAAFANVGLKGGIGGRAFRRILLGLVNPSKKGAAAMRKLGLRTRDLKDESGNMLGPVEIFTKIAEGAKKLDGVERVQALARVFSAFGVGGAAEAASQFSQELDKVNDDGESVIDILKILNRAENARGRAQEVATQRMKTSRGAMLELKSALEGLAIDLSDMKGLREFLKMMTDSVRAVARWVDEDPERAARLVKLFIGATAAATVMGPFLTGMASLARIFAALHSVKGIGGAATLLTKFGMSGKLAFAGIAAAAAGAVAIISHFNDKTHELLAGSRHLQNEIEKFAPKAAAGATDQGLADREAKLQAQIERERGNLRKLQKQRGGFDDFLSFVGAGSLTNEGSVKSQRSLVDGLETELAAIRAEREKRAEVGGKIEVEVTSNGARVRNVQTANPNVPIQVNTGLAGAGA